jgi:two-component system nitrogen regulation response regulator GlnG
MSQATLADASTAAEKVRAGPQTPTVVPALTVLSHPLAHRVGERLLLDGLASGESVRLTRNSPDFTRPGSPLGLPLADPFVSRKPLVFSSGPEGRLRLLVEEEGTRVVAGEPIQGLWEFGPEELAAGVPLELAGRLLLLLHLVRSEPHPPRDTLGMVGQSTGLQLVRKAIEQVADLDVPVLVRGETGTGKELVAQAIHAHSRRRDERFVSVNLGAIPKELAAAELFGAHKGAYTGATRDREGFFRAAQGGTLFLDEVGEASPEVQVMLLRVLETGEMYPVGAHTPVATNVRLIAATDAHLEEHIQQGRFKAPLLHRLAGYSIRLPPLRERREDIGLLFYHFAREELEALGEAWRLKPEEPHAAPWLPASLVARLVRHPWPGNIRQLRNVARQLVIASRGQPTPTVDPQLEQELGSAPRARLGRSAATTPSESLPPALRAPSERAEPPMTPVVRRKPSEISEPELLAALRRNAWDFQAAGDELGIPRASMYDLVKKSQGIRTAGDLSAEELTRSFHECQGDLDAMVQRLEVSKRALRRRVKELGLTPKEA